MSVEKLRFSPATSDHPRTLTEFFIFLSMEHIIEAIKTFNFALATLILVIYAIIDSLYAKYTLDVANYNEFKAATVGASMHFLIAFGVINYTQNWLYVFPLAIGSWIGTYFTVKQARLNKTKK